MRRLRVLSRDGEMPARATQFRGPRPGAKAGRAGDATAARAEREITPALIEGWALGYLGRFASSGENLRRVLLRRIRRYSPEAAMEFAGPVEALIERYRASRLIDDEAYAAARARTLQRRGEPRHRIRARLIAKGVDAAAIGAAVAALGAEGGQPDLAAACAFARRRRLGPYRRSAADPKRELGAFARAGFGRRLAEAVLACPDIAAVEELAARGLD